MSHTCSSARQDGRPRQEIKKGAMPQRFTTQCRLITKHRPGACRKSLNRAAPTADAKAGARFRSVGVGMFDRKRGSEVVQGEPFANPEADSTLIFFQLTISVRGVVSVAPCYQSGQP